MTGEPQTAATAADRAEFETEGWTVMPSRNLLQRGAEQQRVEPRVMDFLVYLSSRPGQVVSKAELAAQLWQAQFVGDDVLAATLYALRKALGDDARRPRFIETVPRRGYRWIAAIASPSTAAGVSSSAASHDSIRWFSPARWRAASMMAAIMFGVLLFTMSLSSTQRRHVPAAASLEAYAEGRRLLDLRTIRSWRQAKELFERAVALDPEYAAAYAGLADTYSAMSDFGIATPVEMRPRAFESAQRAIALDSRSAEGHSALARAQFLFDWDFDAAERSLRKALELNHDYMPAYQTLAWLRSARGDHAGAVTAARRALALDPLTIARYSELTWVLGLDGRHREALQQLDRALEIDPRSVETQMTRGWVYEIAGLADSAFAAFSEGMRLLGISTDSLRRTEAVFRAEGLAGIYRQLIQQRSGMPMSNTWRAQIYARIGEPERAIQHLEQAYRIREGALAWVNVDPSFRPLRADVRFRRIATRVSGQYRKTH